MGKKKYVLLPVLIVCCLISGGCGSTGKTAEDTVIHESAPAVQEENQTKEKEEITGKSAGKTLEGEDWAADGNIFEYEIRELSAQRDENHIYGVAYIPLDAGERIPAVIYAHGYGVTHQNGIQYAEKLATAELKVLPGAGHGLHGQDAETVAEYMLEYLQAHCH